MKRKILIPEIFGRIIKKGIDWKAIIESDINKTIKNCEDIEDFKKRLEQLGYEVKGNKRLSVKHPNQTGFMRTDRISRKIDYSLKGIAFAIEHETMLPKAKELNMKRINSVRDFISTADKSGGLEHWAKISKLLLIHKTFLKSMGLPNTKI